MCPSSIHLTAQQRKNRVGLTYTYTPFFGLVLEVEFQVKQVNIFVIN